MKRFFFILNGERKLKYAIFPLSQQVWVRARERYPARSAAYTLWPRCYGIATRTSAHAPRHPPSYTRASLRSTCNVDRTKNIPGRAQKGPLIIPPLCHLRPATIIRPLVTETTCHSSSTAGINWTVTERDAKAVITVVVMEIYQRTEQRPGSGIGRRQRPWATYERIALREISHGWRALRTLHVSRISLHFLTPRPLCHPLLVRCTTGSPTYYCSCSCSCCCVRKSHSIARKLNIMILFSQQHYILQIELIWETIKYIIKLLSSETRICLSNNNIIECILQNIFVIICMCRWSERNPIIM